MIKLCGFAVSNYYNKVKLALLEKQIPFEEVLVWTDRSPELLARSPLGKVPFIQTDQGSLCESQNILDYLEVTYPAHPLIPKDVFAAAKVKELITFLELHLELVARELYAEAFFGGKVSDEVKLKVEKQLTRNINALTPMLKFAPFVAGDEFTMADCAAAVHFPLVSMATKAIYGRDFLADLPVRDYVKMISERPHMQTINADRKANQVLMASIKK
ncbi:glutathione S-transferase [Undibacterium sp. RTI2.1]|uniref:glutathione S-transferase n=1 Tax=unclassified Undibacterium TaxID=2630295 RepID=UPI002AB4798F|nr:MULTISPECIES: glutathione S-transferase [unclassified Undibacterium]MDY7538183.1 glutathione S-transferase [Undibacterium sp. 5I1]MEB0032394.1 glutathione S-transferase [Undibacterium sp. RTI2.1]MEB0116783.1 glutathione S-transferase [Undibacterium sp. RTI2.2]MEB0229586.1 glutathione S-transferase [Undibacterium sp. 10I3]MEB0257335.1 glutathione S-transferase [Undibacterium sp. 5I1]